MTDEKIRAARPAETDASGGDAMKVSISPERAQQLRAVPPDVLCEAVDAAWLDFLTSIKNASAGMAINPQATLSWMLTQTADEHAHWATELGKLGFVNFPHAHRPYLGKTFGQSFKGHK